jgi:hypothetical protein
MSLASLLLHSANWARAAWRSSTELGDDNVGIQKAGAVFDAFIFAPQDIESVEETVSRIGSRLNNQRPRDED